jgi:hypothetical protein
MALAMAEAAEQPTPAFEELVERGRRVASQISRLDAELVDIVRAIGAMPSERADMSLRQFAAWQFGLTPAESARVCRLGEQLEPLPQLSDELAAGRLSAGTVATLAAVATPANERALIETATVATGAQLQALVRSYKQVTADDDPAPVPDRVSYGIRAGRWQLRADLAPELGAQVAAALRAEKEAALADGGSDDGDGPLSRHPDVSNAVALVGMAQTALSGKVRRDGILPERFQVLIHLDENGAHIQGGGHIDQPSITELLCESWITVLVAKNGQPITITSPTRLATPAQQRALLARDEMCQFPGCGRTMYLKAHHIVHNADGGPTQIDNLCLLCQHHHTLIHKPGWRLERDRTGKLWFTAPDGRIVLPARRPRATGPPPLPAQRHLATYERLTEWGSGVIIDSWLN